MSDILIKDLIQQLKDVENADLWLDENFEKKLSQVNEDQYFTRPLPDLHSVAELLSHLTVWRKINMERLNGKTVVFEVDDPANWKTNDELRKTGWTKLKEDFYDSQKQVIAMLNGKEDSYLETLSTHYGKNYKYLIQGLIHHDFYHLGQMGITIKYLLRNKSGSV